MKRPWSKRLATTASSQSGSSPAAAQSASAATQLAARIATSIVQTQLAPISTGLAAIQCVSCAPSSSE